MNKNDVKIPIKAINILVILYLGSKNNNIIHSVKNKRGNKNLNIVFLNSKLNSFSMCVFISTPK